MTAKGCPAGASRRQLVTGLGTVLAGSALPGFGGGGNPVHAHTETSAGQHRGMPASFGRDYVAGALEPFGRMSIYTGGRLSLPMIDLAFSKEAAIPSHLWGMLYDGWQPNMQEEGLSVFLQGYEHRGPENERKRIYTSALTPDLYRPMYAGKIAAFLDQLFDQRNAGQPLMRPYYDRYFDMYWDLHLGVTGDAIPPEVRQIGASFNAVIGYWNPQLPVVHENYMRVRELRQPLRDWIDARVQDVMDGNTPQPERTFVHYWLRNGQQSDHFRRRDIVFECFHNFLAFSQWGNTLYNIMARLERNNGDPAVREWFRRTMAGEPDAVGQSAFTPLDRLVMELFRTISPNTGSLSTIRSRSAPDQAGMSFILHPHPETSKDARHWADPEAFNPDRYVTAPTGDQITEERCTEIGFARCPFSVTAAPVRDGRDAAMTNSGFGTVHAVVDGKHYPAVDHAGYAPFGFGYRRCAGEWLTIEVFKDVLRKLWRDNIAFARLTPDRPEELPVGPGTVITDDIGFTRAG
jgi:cytochrome P450